jgi:hypothetical protein
METNRLTQIIIMSLSLDIIKAENSLEQEINSTNNIDAKLIKIKEYLDVLIMSENRLNKFNSMMGLNKPE